MRIDRLCDKCILYPETETIRKVELLYDSGLCTILFRDGTSSSFLHDWEAYHVAYYGLCFTSDGKTVFTGSWEKGVYALDTASGKIIWHYRCTKIRELFAFSNYLVAMRSTALPALCWAGSQAVHSNPAGGWMINIS